jgi:hypothetical protein
MEKIKQALVQLNIKPVDLFERVDTNGDGSLDINEIG